ncbi:MAG: hypothetical protein HN352_10575 [Bacteroidetes bacterium]|nr:hypothetical protein [Bacteroidota bacterium]MBT4401356.1 hypothetical protein [Bacteroidota bacterium]MBT4411422.1 hypothetical protein [Bacteroidota bacterium]MBT5426326.1 hypothetical protein [Bacteroidota bacterium]MBT7091988.1 hypothetical protein [Bacteroidota bacterium]
MYRILSGLLLLTICSCEPLSDVPPDDFLPPKVRFNIAPGRGDSTTLFVLNAAGSSDADNIEQLLEYRWDFNSDSIWDTEYSDYPYRIELFMEPGLYDITVEVKDRYGQTNSKSKTIETWGAETDTSSFRDMRDGQVYKTVRLGHLVWMAENLNYGELLAIADTVLDDDIVHKYCYQNDESVRRVLGGALTFYDWMEAKNHDTSSVQGICPDGWELPTRDDWQTIIGTNKGLVKFYAEGGFSNLNLTRIGIQPRMLNWQTIDSDPLSSYWVYLTSEFNNDFYNGREQIVPFVASSHPPQYSNNIYSMRYSGASIKKYMGLAPIRCVKRD